MRDDDGRRIGWLHRVTEHTEQKRLLDSLRQREQLLAAAQSIAQIGSWEWDVTTDTVTWSDQLYRIYDVDPDEFEATYEAFLQFIHPEDRPIGRGRRRVDRSRARTSSPGTAGSSAPTARNAGSAGSAGSSGTATAPR